MTSRVEIIALNIKKRRKKRGLVVLAIVALPLAMFSYLMTARSSEMPPSYNASIPAISTSGSENSPNLLKEDTAIAIVSIPSTPAENAATEQTPLPEDSLASATEVITSNPAREVEEARPPIAPAKVQELTPSPDRLYISMPDYIQMPLTRKMDLMRNNAYSPKEKSKLRAHIINQFANRSRARVSVVDRNGQRDTRSYPIGMYLDRISQHPQLQFRLVEKVSERGQLSGLVVRE